MDTYLQPIDLTIKERSYYYLEQMAAVAHLPQQAPVRAASGIDHVTVAVHDYASGKRFYERALAPLGFALRLDWPARGRAHFGIAPSPSSLWLVAGEAASARVTLVAADRAAVDAFHEAAVAAGGSSSGAPGPRADYTARAYGTEVLDLDGNMVEVLYR